MKHLIGITSIVFVVVVAFLITKRRGIKGVILCGISIIFGVILAVGESSGVDGILYAFIFVVVVLCVSVLVNKKNIK